MASSKVVVVLYAILALAASQIDKSSDVTVTPIQTNVCPGDAQPSGTECVTSCVGHSNGDYQSCTSCHMYVTCSNGIMYKDRPCPANLVWDDEKKLCTWTSATCPSTAQPQSGVFYMNLEDSDLGEDYVDGATWQMLPGLPAASIAAPTATGACDTAVIYKFTPPACIKTVRFQITTNASAEVFVFGVIDDADVSNMEQARTIFLAPAIFSALAIDFNNSMSGAYIHPDSFTTPLCAEITPGAVSYTSTDSGGYTLTSDKFYQRMGAVPFTFSVNVDPLFMVPRPGVCSLKVAWSC